MQKRTRGKRRAQHARFRQMVVKALTEVEAERRRQKKKRSDAFLIAQMAKRNLEPRDQDNAGWSGTNPLHWQLVEKVPV